MMNEQQQASTLAHPRLDGFAHPLFLAQIEALAQQVEAFKQKDPVGYLKRNANKRLAAIIKLAFDVMSADPTPGRNTAKATLGDAYKHWFRAKSSSSTACSFATTRPAR